MDKLKVIVIGLGRIGLKNGLDLKRKQPASHVAAIIENKNLQLVGACDPNEETRNIFLQTYKQKINMFSEPKQILEFVENFGCDIIVIATPETMHSKMLENIIKKFQNIQKPMIIFCEKPISLEVESAIKLQKILKNPNLKIVVHHNRRWSKIWQEAYHLLSEIGEIKNAAFYFSTSPENKKFDQMRDGIHIADIISWFGITGKTIINRLNVPYFMYDFYLWGTKGKIEILNVDQVLNFYKVNESQRFQGFEELELEHTRKIDESTFSSTYTEFVDFLTGKRSSLSTDLNDAILSLQVFEEYVYDKKIN